MVKHKWKYVLVCMSKQNSENFIQQQDSQVNNCSMCPMRTLTTVFNLIATDQWLYWSVAGRDWPSRYALCLWDPPNPWSEVQDIPVKFWISLGLLLDPGLPSWLHISSATCSIFCVVRTVRFRPLPTFREIEFVLSILCKRSLTELTAKFLLGNSLQMRLAPYPFSWQTSLIDALSSYIKRMFINKLLGHNDVTLFSP